MRECGECTRCCYTMSVPEYNSPANSYCTNCNVGVGCSIHEEREQVCKNFSCLWLTQEQIPESLRPDKCHVLFELPPNSMTYVGYVDQDHPDAYNEPNVRNLIQKITEAGHPVVLYQGDDKQKLYALPEGMTKEQVQEDVKNAYVQLKKAGRVE